MQILQLIPRRPPPVCGVAEYALHLARTLRDRHRIQTHFISASPRNSPAIEDMEFQVDFLSRPSITPLQQRLLATPKTAGLVLQYSGYGFAPRGAPLWLAIALRQLHRQNRLPPLHIMFHELYSRGSWRTSSFWNWPLQRWVVKELCAIATTVITNREASAVQLAKFRPPGKSGPKVLPVVSGFGEPSHLPSYEDRAPSMAYFAWQMSQEQAAFFAPRLKAAMEQTGAAKLVVFRSPLPKAMHPDVPVESHGVLPSAEVSMRLLNCRYAFSDYLPHCLGKSSLYAAYCAHGLATVLHEGHGQLPDGLSVGQHLLSVEDRSSSPSAMSIAEHANVWYRQHDLVHTANFYSEAIESSANSTGLPAGPWTPI